MRPGSQPVETRRGVVTGWRCWTVPKGETLLRPIYMKGLVWKPGEPFEATCPQELHAVPAEGCKCGIWAVCHPLQLDEVSWSDHRGTIIVGQVALWGNVLEFERGWRGQFAYPTHLYAFTDDELLAQTLRERYVVPVAWGAEADLLRSILPKSFTPGGRAPAAVPQIPTGIGIPTGVAAMVQAHEAQRLEQLRAAAQLEQDRVQQAREAYRQERKLVKAQIREERERLKQERDILELERQRNAIAGERHSLARSPSRSVTGQLTKLKQQLEEGGITQARVAEEAGVTRSLVSNILAGRGRSANVLGAIERLLGVTPTVPNWPARLNSARKRLKKGGPDGPAQKAHVEERPPEGEEGRLGLHAHGQRPAGPEVRLSVVAGGGPGRPRRSDPPARRAAARPTERDAHARGDDGHVPPAEGG